MSNRKPENPENVRKRMADMAARKRADGLMKVCVWVPKEKANDLKEYAAKLKPKT